MNTVTVHGQFQDGMASDLYQGGNAEFSVAKHFDILSYPGRLQPLRGMAVESVTNTSIGNIIVGLNGFLYGVGEDPANPGISGKLWVRADSATTASSTGSFGNSAIWRSLTTNQLSGAVYKSGLLVDFKNAGNVKTLIWASTNLLVASDPIGASSVSTQALTFTNIGQGFVHQQYQILFIPYQTSSGTFIATISSDATPFNTKSLTALSLPAQYQVPCLTNYQNYLAIPGFSVNGVGVNGSIVFLWDTTSATWNEQINWGQGQLKVLNNLNGVLIGISTSSANYNNSIQDADSILIKEYSGGIEPILIKEIIAQHFAAGSTPSVTINQNVNFIYKNRLYFSANIVPNDGTSNTYYGLWSVGKNRINGRYSVNLERMATNDGSETGVRAAAISGDFVSMCHTVDGTLTYTSNGQTSSSTYGATSVYESVVNPSMGTNRYTRLHPLMKKQMLTFAVHTLPLLSGQQVVGKFRVDATSGWTTAFTKTSSSPVGGELVVHEQVKDANGDSFTAGRNFEFRLESTGGAVITGYTYTYEILKTNLGEKL